MSPSSAMGSGLDRLVKEALVQEALSLASMPACPKERYPADCSARDAWKVQMQWREEHERRVLRGYERVLPPPDPATKQAQLYADIAAFKR